MENVVMDITPVEDQTVADFEQLYLAVREWEGRVYTDEEVKQLPDISPSHKYYAEWQIRKRSANRLIKYLRRKERSLNILEIGCGNGWLSNQLAHLPQIKVTGLDINTTEIEQANQVFRKNNLRFLNAEFSNQTFEGDKFDVIVFAACLPYFPSLKETLFLAINYLRDDGEIHITDTNFYNPEDVPTAVNRCREYYEKIGYPQMMDEYYHHTINELKVFTCSVLLNPNNVFNKIFHKDPFYWIRITK